MMSMKLSLWLAAALAALFPSPALAAPAHRAIPAGHHWGRCLLVVRGQTRIDGPCTYSIGRGGNFHIDGPRQVFAGIDFPRPVSMSHMQSADYWADVFRGYDGAWTGYGNEDIDAVHGEGPFYGPLRREGACMVGAEARICLWRN
jgi:hypothetical protein